MSLNQTKKKEVAKLPIYITHRFVIVCIPPSILYYYLFTTSSCLRFSFIRCTMYKMLSFPLSFTILLFFFFFWDKTNVVYFVVFLLVVSYASTVVCAFIKSPQPILVLKLSLFVACCTIYLFYRSLYCVQTTCAVDRLQRNRENKIVCGFHCH